jgi:hypothetical protein
VGREALAAMPDEERVCCTLDLKLGDVLWEQGERFFFDFFFVSVFY